MRCRPFSPPRVQFKINTVLDKALDVIFKPVVIVGDLTGRMTTTQKMASGGAVAVVGGGVSMVMLALAVPVGFMALLFLPLTLLGGVSGELSYFCVG